MASVMDLVNQHGGLPGLLQKFQESGLGDRVAASWIGTGATCPSPANRSRMRGADTISQIAEKRASHRTRPRAAWQPCCPS